MTSIYLSRTHVKTVRNAESGHSILVHTQADGSDVIDGAEGRCGHDKADWCESGLMQSGVISVGVKIRLSRRKVTDE